MTPAAARVTSANGKIAFDRADPQSPGDTFIYTANPDGSHARQLVAVHGSNPSWSHDGTRLALATSTPDGRITTATVHADGSNFPVLPLPDPTLNVATEAMTTPPGAPTGPWGNASPANTRLGE